MGCVHLGDFRRVLWRFALIVCEKGFEMEVVFLGQLNWLVWIVYVLHDDVLAGREVLRFQLGYETRSRGFLVSVDCLGPRRKVLYLDLLITRL